MSTTTTFTGFLYVLITSKTQARILLTDVDSRTMGKQYLSLEQTNNLINDLNCSNQITGTELKYGCPLYKVDSSILTKYNLFQIAPRKETIQAGKELLAEYFAETAQRLALRVSVIDWSQDVPTDNIILCFEINGIRQRISFTLEAVEDVISDPQRQFECKEKIEDALFKLTKST